ncbi:MAG: hypothetical protein LBC70_07960 [Chitinispirillales bacterium]|jgi:hypothetical protein|nr:hypothetical protein [Chitinispirillales bacterium]
MNKKLFFIHIACVFLLTLTLPAAASDPRLGLRHRLDSLEVEKQALKRQGEPIAALETAAAALRDSLLEMREHAGALAGETGGELSSGLPFGLDRITFPDWLQPFQPHNLFDWIIVGTGLLALLSGALLVFGLILGKRKKGVKPKKQPAAKSVGRKINLAPAESPPIIPGPKFQPPSEPRDGLSDLQSLMENLRRAAPPPNDTPLPLEPSYTPHTPAHSAKPAAPPPLPPRPLPPLEDEGPPPPLFVPAGDTSFPPPPEPKPAPGTPVNELVIAAAKSGMNDQEISRRYQISVDQVKLILRMAKG